MHLDESILQSTTTLNLVEFIDELWDWLQYSENEMDYDTRGRLTRIHEEIKLKADKAKKKRSF